MNSISISKEEFLSLNEENIMFITNPGRMGDEDGSTFIEKQGNTYVIYRVNGWLYPNKEANITFGDMLNQFPKWKEILDNRNNKNYDGKYKYVYMGFGNGLAIDKSIYDAYYVYLQKEVEEVMKQYSSTEIEPSMYYAAWYDAFENMINDINKKD